MEKKSRDQFRTRLGFIVACIGSAVGMGIYGCFPIGRERSEERPS